MARHMRGRPARDRARVQLAAAAVAGIFLLIGVLGFIPGVTTDYGDLAFAGHHSGAMLLGLVQVSVLHNLVHLGSGLLGLALARSVVGARVFLGVGGALYLGVWVYGLAIADDSGANWLPVDAAGDWLHLVLGFGMLALGLLLSPRSGTGGRPDTPIDRP
ncbi:protein of unknown function [Micromonospora nigra]|uniref:DUF4383 domain-containing protein n=1 Tax=Micromonospora nigra TaxID=145857 RepID=A0A1C6RK73_9ACTN|nr:DUF4383 domain-containing protein [Micromonospora nigra]SCL17568.1 protein of unknown function [Micromonospora nigra]